MCHMNKLLFECVASLNPALYTLFIVTRKNLHRLVQTDFSPWTLHGVLAWTGPSPVCVDWRGIDGGG